MFEIDLRTYLQLQAICYCSITLFTTCTIGYSEPEKQQNARPFGSSMAEWQRIGCLDARPCNCKQTASLGFPIHFWNFDCLTVDLPQHIGDRKYWFCFQSLCKRPREWAALSNDLTLCIASKDDHIDHILEAGSDFHEAVLVSTVCIKTIFLVKLSMHDMSTIDVWPKMYICWFVMRRLSRKLQDSYCIDIWPARDSRLTHRETNQYIARYTSVFPLSYLAGRLPEQFWIASAFYCMLSILLKRCKNQEKGQFFLPCFL